MISLSLAALKLITDRKQLAISPSSPFGFLAHRKSSATPEQQSSAIGELERIGIKVPKQLQENVCFAHPDAEAFQTSIELLANPAIRVRMSILGPGSRPTLIPIFSAAGLATLAYFDTESFHIGKPMDSSILSSVLAREIIGEAAPDGQQTALAWPIQVRFATVLWRSAKLRAGVAITRDSALGELARNGFEEEKASQVISGMVTSGFLKESAGEISLKSPYNHFIGLLWSGHVVEIEKTPLSNLDAEDLAKVRMRSRRLVAVGPPGVRALYRCLRPQRAAAANSQINDIVNRAREETILTFEHLSEGAAVHVLQDFLNLSRSHRPSSSESAVSGSEPGSSR